jgi:hypothetical protein
MVSNSFLSIWLQAVVFPVALAAPALEQAKPAIYIPKSVPKNVASGPSSNFVALSAAELTATDITELPGFDPTGGASILDGRDIIGSDNRVLWNHTEFPYTASEYLVNIFRVELIKVVGRIERSDGLVCSASM